MDLANFWTEKVNEHTWKHCWDYHYTLADATITGAVNKQNSDQMYTALIVI